MGMRRLGEQGMKARQAQTQAQQRSCGSGSGSGRSEVVRSNHNKCTLDFYFYTVSDEELHPEVFLTI
ncbi:hypothetical protein V6N13_071166 [Hibiscus sabdariffa]|uniref:Uncharacterized protein n=1 Tax=Hibiscus sabdariffa TaxID=183260 RepID=A0ABR2TE78_9ROSI